MTPSPAPFATAHTKRDLPPPFINLDSVANLRDVGGLPITDHSNCAVRKRILYRSADPSRLNPTDLQTVHQKLGVHTIFDLRSGPEIEKAGTLEAWQSALDSYNASLPKGTEGIIRKWKPIFAEEDYSPESIAKRYAAYGSSNGDEGFVEAYSQILSHAGPTLKEVLGYLASPNPKGILVHCTAGKDRAGSVVAIILGLLGVPVPQIAEEYNLTEAGLAHLRPLFVDRSMASGAFGPEGSEQAREAATRMTGARKEAMLGTHEMIRRKYGGVEKYLTEYVEISQETIDRVRANLIVDEAGSPNTLLAKL